MSCSNITQGISKGCNNNLGGIKKIYIADRPITGYVILANGQIRYFTPFNIVWLEIEADQGTGNFTETYEINQAGSIIAFKQSVTFQINDLSAYNQQTIKELAESTNLGVVVEMNNGKFFTVGIDRGAYLETGSTGSGTAYGDLSGSTITITGMEEISSLEVQPGLLGVNLQPTPYSIIAAFRVTNVPVNDIPFGASFGYTAETSRDLVIAEMPNICDSTYEGFTGVSYYLKVGDTFDVGTQLYGYFGEIYPISNAYTYGFWYAPGTPGGPSSQPYCTDLLTDVFQLTFTADAKIATKTPYGQV